MSMLRKPASVPIGYTASSHVAYVFCDTTAASVYGAQYTSVAVGLAMVTPVPVKSNWMLAGRLAHTYVMWSISASGAQPVLVRPRATYW